MLNYLSAEFYKLRFHKGLYVGTGLLLLLELLVFLPGVMVREQEYIPQDTLLAFLGAAMSVGIIIAPIFAAMVFDNQNGNGTLKNEVVFGVPKSRIYIGKLAAGAIVGTGIAILAIGFFLLLTLCLGGKARGEASLLDFFLEWIAVQWLTWLSVYAFSFLMLALVGSPATAMTLVYLITMVSLVMSPAICDSNLHFIWRLMASLSFTAPLALVGVSERSLGVILPLLGENVLLYALVVCLVWWGLSIGCGILLLRRREIK